MPRTGGLLDLWATFKQARRAAGLPVIDAFGADNRLVPLAEANDGTTDLATLTEAATPSDFPNALGNTLYRELVTWAGNMMPEEKWRTYFRVSENQDFRPKNEILGAEMEDLLPVPTGAEYKDSSLSDAFYQVQLAPYGRLFGVNRETIVNDDIGFLRDMPQRMARTASRTLNKYMVRTILEGNVNSYDGTAVYTSGHGNLLSGGSSALSSTSLQTAIYTMMTSVGDANLFPSGGPLSLDAKYLVVPPALRFQAASLINSALIVAAGGVSPDQTFGNINPLQNILTPVVDRWLTSATAWYIFADPAESPAFHAAFLRGKLMPDLLIERPYMTSVAGGGDDQFEVEIDRLQYKIRHNWGASGAVPFGSIKSAGA